ncbi:ImmA/IrrE family metallo-endopeptidase [Rhodospirillales bacterium]|nr:ImmA/IrrE family metallo-endopeptidase [Rhodospirillales bacterium]
MKNSGITIENKSRIEELANGLNNIYFTTHSKPLETPIPIEDIAEHHLGYSIEFVNDGIFSDPEILGGIDFEQNKIYVNASVEDHDGRYGFTIAHEIGHHTLHKDDYLKETARGERRILCRDVREKPKIELEADYFAAVLLMPSETIKNIFKDIRKKKPIRSIGQARSLASQIISVGSFNNVSNSAMVNRLIDLKLIPNDLGYHPGINSVYRSRSLLSLVLARIFNKIS